MQNQTGTTSNHYLYTGQQFDPSSGLYSLRARYYAPGVGRFLSQDTYAVNFSNPIELNRYGYTANNPVNASDPSGHASTKEYGLITASVLTALSSGFAAFGESTYVFLVRSQLIIASYIPWLVPWNAQKILNNVNNLILTGRFTYEVARDVVSAWQTGTEESDDDYEETIVDLGSGEEGLWARQLKILNPNARVIATETGPTFRVLAFNLQGSGVEVINGWTNVPSGIADHTWAVAPYTDHTGFSLRIEEGKAGLRITKSGGIFHMVVRYNEISKRSELDAELLKISSTQNWRVQNIPFSALGIPSQYYESDYNVWYITTTKE